MSLYQETIEYLTDVNIVLLPAYHSSSVKPSYFIDLKHVTYCHTSALQNTNIGISFVNNSIIRMCSFLLCIKKIIPFLMLYNNIGDLSRYKCNTQANLVTFKYSIKLI